MSVLEALSRDRRRLPRRHHQHDRRLGVADHASPRCWRIGYPPSSPTSATPSDQLRQHERRGRLPARAAAASATACSCSGAASLIGGITGGVLLLTLPSSVFHDVVPVLILLAVRARDPPAPAQPSGRRAAHRAVEHGGVELWVGVFLTGIYGGLLRRRPGCDPAARCSGSSSPTTLQRLNAVKNVLALIANGVAAVLFVFFADVAWEVGRAHRGRDRSWAGSSARTVGRRLPAPALRGRDRRRRPGRGGQAADS